MVGWTGSRFAADLALEALGRRLSPKGLRDDVEAGLLDLDTSVLVAPITLVGWVVEDQPHAFLWQSSAPSFVHWGGPWFVGAGGVLLDQMVGPEGIQPIPDSSEESPDPVTSLLWLATNLMADEVLGQGLRSLSSGHAYELLWWTGDSFEYVNDILYVTLQVVFDDKGAVRDLQLLEPSFKYFARGELSVVATLRPSQREIDVHLITPVGVSDPMAVNALTAEISDPSWHVPLRSTVYGVFLDLRARDYVGPLLALVIRDDAQPDSPVFNEIPGGLDIQLPEELLAWMYQTIGADQTRS